MRYRYSKFIGHLGHLLVAHVLRPPHSRLNWYLSKESPKFLQITDAKQETLCCPSNEASGLSANLKLTYDGLLNKGPTPLVFSPLQLKASAETLALELILFNRAKFLRLLLPTQ